jgi:carnosine N-methyltransferase
LWIHSKGQLERKIAYDPLVNTLIDYYKHIPASERHQLKVLVPGAGLGRLAYDIVRHGFSTQGNEFSFHMVKILKFDWIAIWL